MSKFKEITRENKIGGVLALKGSFIRTLLS
jgi:hypothetical protein